MASGPSGLASPILEPDDMQGLRSEGTVMAGTGDRMHRLHKRRLNRSSDEEYAPYQLPSPPLTDSSISPPPVVRTLSANTAHHYTQIPTYLYSEETLLYMGFNSIKAATIWSRWSNWGPDDTREVDGGHVTFLSMATVPTLLCEGDAHGPNDQPWYSTMEAMGMSAEFQAAIMDANFRSIRLSMSCKDWVVETLEARYSALVAIQAVSRERAQDARRAASRPGASGFNTTLAVQRTSTPVPQPSPRTPGMSLQAASSPSVRENAPGQTLLWRGDYEQFVNGLFDENGRVTGIRAKQPSNGDFNCGKTAWYFAVDVEVAEAYAAYCKRRSSDSSVILLRVEIRNSAIEVLNSPAKATLYYPNQDWKELVYTCRRGLRPPDHLAQYAAATLIIGHICRRPNVLFERMDSTRDINDGMVLRNPRGTYAVQYAFIGDNGCDFLETYATDSCSMHQVNSAHAHTVGQILAGLIQR